MVRLVGQPASQLVSQSACQLVSQPVSQLVCRPASLSACQSSLHRGPLCAAGQHSSPRTVKPQIVPLEGYTVATQPPHASYLSLAALLPCPSYLHRISTMHIVLTFPLYSPANASVH